jgi:AhpD family alkylhydroperoxidase
MTHELVVQPPARIPWYLRPALWLARRMTGKDPLPGRLLAHSPKAALSVGLFEAAAPHGPGDLDTRVLAIARIVASAVAGCPFCVDMNAATWSRAGLTVNELEGLLRLDAARWTALAPRELTAARYARALSATPVLVDGPLRTALRAHFSEREVVVLAHTVAQVNYWSRFNQGLGVPSAGFFDESVCALPTVRS